uniref:Conjugative relaxase domain protein n=1 Tax=Cyanothece sp. (strain PCC 7425 / ATCC 29141) TaxID=395961 RepID=B8HZ01_CYAP4
MRSLHTITSGHQEKEDYYTQDESLCDGQADYYGQSAQSTTESSVQSLTQALWYGKGAARLGLVGIVQRQDFQSVFYGDQPGGQERIRGERPNPDTKERLAHDLTLSAPKSVSMTLHLGGDERLFQAHLEAVQETLDLVESRYAQTRVQIDGERRVMRTGHLIAAILPHHTSREGDLQLHCHCVLMNGTFCPDGNWRSLWHEGMVNAEWLGSYYRLRLAQKVQDLGYAIDETRLEQGGAFEIQGYSREAIEAFSKRSRQIVAYLEQHRQCVNSATRDGAVLTTRKAKQMEGTLEDYQARWRLEANVLGINAVLPQAQPVTLYGYGTAREELASAIRHLSERSVSFSREDLYSSVFDRIQAFDIAQLDAVIAEQKDLIPVQGGRFTTVTALEREITTLRDWMQGQGKTTPLMDETTAQALLERSALNSGQATAIAGIVSAGDQHLILHGLSGVGKTTALRELKRLIQESDSKPDIRGYSPTIAAAATLAQSLQISTSTVESLVLKPPEPLADQLWIIDEAGMISARQMAIILKKANAVGARLLLVGDPRQNPAIEAGSPMRSLIQHGATTFSLREIIRQQNAVQRRAVELMATGHPVHALSLLTEHGYVQEISDPQARSQAIAHQWLTLSDSERQNTLIVTGTNAERRAIHQQLRRGLRDEEGLGEDQLFRQLINRQLTTEQKLRWENYRVGDYIRLHRNYESTLLGKGRLYQVVGIRDRQLLVESEGGRLLWFDPARYRDKEVFKTGEIAIAPGEQLRWTLTDRKTGQINGSQVSVREINDDHLTVVDDQGQEWRINGRLPLTLDYAHVTTAYSAQGLTAERVIVSATNNPTSAQEPFYVKISRQVRELQIYVEDLEGLREWVGRSVAQMNPLELIGGHDVKRERQFGATGAHDEPEAGQPDRPEQNLSGGEHSLKVDAGLEPQYRPPHHATGTSDVSRPVPRGSGEAEAFGDVRCDSSTGFGSEGIEGPDRPFSIDRYPDQLVPQPDPSRNQCVNPLLIQQRFDQIAQQMGAVFPGNPETSLNATFGQSHYRGLAEFAQELEYLGEEDLCQTLQDITHALVEVERCLERSLQQVKLDTITDALQSWRSEQALSEAIAQIATVQAQAEEPDSLILGTVLQEVRKLPYRREEVDHLVERVEEWQAEQDLSAVLEQLGRTINELKPSFFSPGYQAMAELAEAVGDRPAEAVIREHLQALQDATLQIQQRLLQNPGLEQLAVAVRSLRENPVIAEGAAAEPLQQVAEHLTAYGLNPTPPPQKLQPFWQPQYLEEPPAGFDPVHWQEFQRSAIHPDLIVANAESIDGWRVYERLLSEKLAEMGSGQYVTAAMAREMRRYEQVAEGGWWGKAGIDPQSLPGLQPGEQPTLSTWGCFKPDHPRMDVSKSDRTGQPKTIKYEHPVGVQRGLYLPIVPDSLAKRIYQKYQIQPTSTEQQSGFWFVVLHYNLPITITEGVKKTWASLSQGEVTIGVSGVNGLYRTTDVGGHRLPQRQLHPDIAIFVTPGREFRFAYDHDTKPATVYNVQRDRVRGIELLEARGCLCKIVQWSGDKGLDDLIAHQGANAYTRAQLQAISAEPEKQNYYRSQYRVIARQVQQELGSLTAEQLDREVYRRAITRGDLLDGERFLRFREDEQAEISAQPVRQKPEIGVKTPKESTQFHQHQVQENDFEL